jgi:hypothetical protein
MNNEKKLFQEFHSEINDIVRRIGVACTAQWARIELERVLNETKYKDILKRANT